mmetsp:Transcript_97172/g.294961  ORF Transcript_97172/g.294961 Transcript_97172/m.294961 type:complete len:293 (+) Transcript_97172:1-879(+)
MQSGSTASRHLAMSRRRRASVRVQVRRTSHSGARPTLCELERHARVRPGHGRARPRGPAVRRARAGARVADVAELRAPAVVQAAVPDRVAVHGFAVPLLVPDRLCPGLALANQNWPHLVDAVLLDLDALGAQLLVHAVAGAGLDHLPRHVHGDLVLLLHEVRVGDLPRPSRGLGGLDDLHLEVPRPGLLPSHWLAVVEPDLLDLLVLGHGHEPRGLDRVLLHDLLLLLPNHRHLHDLLLRDVDSRLHGLVEPLGDHLLVLVRPALHMVALLQQRLCLGVRDRTMRLQVPSRQ